MSQLLYNLSQTSQVDHKGVVTAIESCHLNDDISEALETLHLLNLKEEDWSTEVKHLLTSLRASKSRFWKGNAPPTLPEERWRPSTMAEERYSALPPLCRSVIQIRSAGASLDLSGSVIAPCDPFEEALPILGELLSPVRKIREESFEFRRWLSSNSWFCHKISNKGRGS